MGIPVRILDLLELSEYEKRIHSMNHYPGASRHPSWPEGVIDWIRNTEALQCVVENSCSDLSLSCRVRILHSGLVT
jgi:hypothetical protein